MSWNDEEEKPKKRVSNKPRFTTAGERLRPVHKPFKRSECTWIDGIGWVHNPTNRYFHIGEDRWTR